MSDVRITAATGDDADRLTALIHASAAYSGDYASIIDGYRVTADYIGRHRVFTARDPAGRLVGFYALVLDPPELDLAFVADDAQGLGVGRRLIEHMIGEARDAGLPEVRVVSHPPAEHFYRRLGAEPAGTVPPNPPKIPWPRPDLKFPIPRTAKPSPSTRPAS
ncbi:MAG: GNAT family N-acetyltransferase [Stackebrandtia sp.]